MLEVVGDDDVRLRLESRRQDIGVCRVWLSAADRQEIIEVFDHGVLERFLHRSSRLGGGAGAIRPAFLRHNVLNRPLRFVQHRPGPANPEKLRLGQCQEQIALEDANQRARVDKGRVAIGEQRLIQVGVGGDQLGERVAAFVISLLLVGEEGLGFDPAMTPNEQVGDLTLLE
jgi:hypothetical protein